VETLDEQMADLLLIEYVPDELQHYADRSRPPERLG
jgi:hypothetical protein